MDKLKMQTSNIVNENVEKIGKLFPNCIIEKKAENGVWVKAIDFDILKQELSDFVVDGDIERFQFNWPGKKESILKANTQINGTLRPEVDKSLNFETTQNLYIEGDNLEVLKLLRETYLNKIRVIYIDPPYNTGKDSFLYDDDRHLSMKEYIEKSKVKDDKGNLLFDISINNESNGQFHSDWLSMMYPRLKLAHSMLTEDGLMFISIDECEFYAMKRICNEIFGQSNCMGEFIWENRTTPNDADNMFAMTHEYILIYAKDISQVSFIGEKKDFSNYINPDNDPQGEWAKDKRDRKHIGRRKWTY